MVASVGRAIGIAGGAVGGAAPGGAAAASAIRSASAGSSNDAAAGAADGGPSSTSEAHSITESALPSPPWREPLPLGSAATAGMPRSTAESGPSGEIVSGSATTSDDSSRRMAEAEPRSTTSASPDLDDLRACGQTSRSSA